MIHGEQESSVSCSTRHDFTMLAKGKSYRFSDMKTMSSERLAGRLWLENSDPGGYSQRSSIS